VRGSRGARGGRAQQQKAKTKPASVEAPAHPVMEAPAAEDQTNAHCTTVKDWPRPDEEWEHVVWVGDSLTR
jgi:hypothetical protein